MQDLLDKLSELTTIPKFHLNKFKNCLYKIYSNDIVVKSINDSIIELTTLEGSILITVDNDTVKYKFIPNEEFTNLVVSSIIEHKDDLVITALDRLKSAFINTYKDIL